MHYDIHLLTLQMQFKRVSNFFKSQVQANNNSEWIAILRTYWVPLRKNKGLSRASTLYFNPENCELKKFTFSKITDPVFTPALDLKSFYCYLISSLWFKYWDEQSKNKLRKLRINSYFWTIFSCSNRWKEVTLFYDFILP